MKRKLIIIAILLVLILAGYLTYRYFFYTCCALPPKRTSPITSNGSVNDPFLSDPGLLYAKRALIGFCRTKSGNGGSCHFNTYLYSSGKLIVESGELAMTPEGEKAAAYPTVEKQLNKSLMDKIVTQIRDSEIMTKPCEEELIMDYYVDYFIKLDDVKKEVKFPGCEAEFKAIDALIGTAVEI